MLAHIALAIAPIITPAAIPTPHTLTALAPVEVWTRAAGDLRGIVVDAEDRVWVTDHAGGRVLRLDAPGPARVVAAGLHGPLGIALDRSGRILVAEEGAGRIVQLVSGGKPRSIASGLERPRWLAIGDDGTIYVSAHQAVREHDTRDRAAPGVVLALHDGRATVLAHGLDDPEGLAIHDGDLHVATRKAIVRIPLAHGGELVDDRGDATVRKPVGLAVDAIGTLFATARRVAIADEHLTGVIARTDATADVDIFANGADEPQGLAFDRDGNLYMAERRAGRVVRFVAPRPPALSPPPEWTSAAGVTLAGHTEAEARVEATTGQTSAGAFAGASGTFGLSLPLAPGVVNDVTVRAIGHDGAGLASPAVTLTIVQDSSPPMVGLQSPPSGAVVRGAVGLQASVTDAGSELARIELLAAGHTLPVVLKPTLPAAQVTAGAEWNSAADPDGVHTVVARAADRAGNITSLTRAVTVDNTPPVTAIAGPDTTAAGLRFTFTGSDNLTPAADLEFAWRVDGGAWSAFSAAMTASVGEPSPGRHRIEAKARDRAGNEDPAPAALVFTAGGGGLGVAIVEPVPGAVLSAGTTLVRGTIDGGGADVGVMVNGLPAWLDGSVFTALADLDPATSTIVATAVADDGRTGRASIPVTVSGATPLTLLATPSSGVAPLAVRFSLSRDPSTARVELDSDGDGVTDVDTPSLDERVVTYARPGTYVARARVSDLTGGVTTASAIVRVFDAAALDRDLQARWSAMRDALRRGDVAAGVSHIVQRRRADYEAAFRLLSASLPAIDSILTAVTPLTIRNASAIYEMRRADDGLLKSFEIRFAIDGDGIWRLEAF